MKGGAPLAPQMRAAPALLLLTITALVAAPVAAQTFLRPGDVSFELSAGGTAERELTVRNALNRSLTGFARVQGGITDGATISPAEFRVGALGSRTLTLTIEANELSRGEHSGHVQVLVVDPETGQTQRLRSNVSVVVPAPTLLFDTWENPMPDPLDNVYGLFIVETSIWIVGAFIAQRLAAGGTRFLMGRSPRWLKKEVSGKFTTPLFIVIVLIGLRGAWRFFPPGGLADGFRGFFTVLIVLTSAFLVYRVTDSILVYLKEQVAPKTQTKWDDVILPVVRKLAIAVLGAFAFFYALEGIGVDLGVLVAGGVVVGLVLSNSLGPTLQNLFSGLFIMIDRPFTEGDDIRLDTGEVTRVEKIGLRSTRLYFYRNHEYIIAPNKDLENARVVNLNYPDRRYKMHIGVGVAYGSPVADVRRLLEEVAEEHPEVYIDEELRSGVFFDEFGDSALLFRLVVFVNTVADRFRIASEIRDMIDAKFRESGITIPFPQRTLWLNEIDPPIQREDWGAQDEREAPPPVDEAEPDEDA